MDYEEAKQTIDGMKWVRSRRQQQIAKALNAAKNRRDTFTEEMILNRSGHLLSKPPLREAGLEAPVFYAFQARAEWEMLGLAGKPETQLKKEYRLRHAGSDGIGLDWYKLGQRIWVPADWLEATIISPRIRAIFDDDEANCFGYLGDGQSGDAQLVKRVLGGTSKAKIKALEKDHEWREAAREYSLRLLDCVGSNFSDYVQHKYRPILEALLVGYRSEMRR